MSIAALDTSSWTPAERQAAARDAYRASGYRLSGAELGQRFGRSGRWGRAQIEAVATEDRVAAAGTLGDAGISPSAAGGTARPGVGQTVAAIGDAASVGEPAAAAIGDPSDASAESVAVDGSQAGEPDGPAAVRWASAGAVVAVAFVAAVASYTHMLDLARHAGEGWLALLLPISVDGLVVAGSTTMVVRRRKGHGGGWLAWLAVGLGIGASLAANVVAADPSLVDPDVVRRVIAGWPPVALAISGELALQLRSADSQRRGQ